MAVICVIGGLLLAKAQIKKPKKTALPVASATPAILITSGKESPAVNDTSGDVSINYGNPKKK
jgi:hypothetical protein